MNTIEQGLNSHLMPVLDKTTEAGLIVLGCQTGAPLLRGKHLFEFLKHFGTHAPDRPKNGLYFIFYVEKEVIAPMYVGRGKIPGRILQHFGQDQHIDQMLAAHTGGRHYYAVHFSDLTREAYNNGLETIAVRFVFVNDEHERAQNEKALIHALRPIANYETYLRPQGFHTSADGYDLRVLANEWLVVNGAQPLAESFDLILDKFRQ